MRARQPYTRHKPTEFELKWGINAKELAREEGVSPTAINMRVMLYGTPFQRAKEPQYYEVQYGMTLDAIAQTLDIRLDVVTMRQRLYGSPFIVKRRNGFSESYVNTKKKVYQGWLHPMHSNYAEWMETCRLKREAIEYVTTPSKLNK